MPETVVDVARKAAREALHWYSLPVTWTFKQFCKLLRQRKDTK